jgi:hypothetical protein
VAEIVAPLIDLCVAARGAGFRAHHAE